MCVLLKMNGMMSGIIPTVVDIKHILTYLLFSLTNLLPSQPRPQLTLPQIPIKKNQSRAGIKHGSRKESKVRIYRVVGFPAKEVGKAEKWIEV